MHYVMADSSGSSFEEELQWCIWQLEKGLLRRDASKSQKEDNTRHLKVLRSTKAPLPKKRQVMRSLFGDYRTKMKAAHPTSKAAEPSIAQASRKACSESAKFYRHCTAQKDTEKQTDASLEQFSFNFTVS